MAGSSLDPPGAVTHRALLGALGGLFPAIFILAGNSPRFPSPGTFRNACLASSFAGTSTQLLFHSGETLAHSVSEIVTAQVLLDLKELQIEGIININGVRLDLVPTEFLGGGKSGCSCHELPAVAFAFGDQDRVDLAGFLQALDHIPDPFLGQSNDAVADIDAADVNFI
jgi:hypothetical protein